jgi:cell division septum initiation protein DivIVA
MERFGPTDLEERNRLLREIEELKREIEEIKKRKNSKGKKCFSLKRGDPVDRKRI